MSAAPVTAILRRIGTGLLVIWGAVTATFFALALMSGDIVQVIAGPTVKVSPALRQQIEQNFDLDRPLLVRYGDYLVGILHGDLGQSYTLRRSVTAAIGEQLPNSITLLLSATVLGVVLATVTAVLTAHRGRRVRGIAQGIESLGVAVPPFWLGILLITVFAFGLHLFPSTGAVGPQSLVLPTLALGLPVAATLSQVMRDSLEKTLDQPFIVSVRARGAAEIGVRLRHALRHSLIATITLVGWVAGTLIGGSVIVEQVFSRPGIGRMMFTAVSGRDAPVVLGIVLIAAVFYVVVNTVIDLLYPIIDPRLRS